VFWYTLKTAFNLTSSKKCANFYSIIIERDEDFFSLSFETRIFTMLLQIMRFLFEKYIGTTAKNAKCTVTVKCPCTIFL